MILRPVALLLMAVPPLAAQEDCFPSTSSNEARTFAILSAPLAFAAGGPIHPDRWNLAAEVASIPEVPRDVATPTTCRPGKGPENTNPLAAIGRLRGTVRLGAWILEGGWIPPIRVRGVRANLVSVALARPVVVAPGWMLTPRVHATFGALRAPVTCNDDALLDPASECFGGTRSDDRWQPGVHGAELTVSRGAGWVLLHGGAGWSLLRPRFRVHFTNALGETDRRRVEVDLSRVAAFAGGTVALGRLRVTAEGYATVGEPLLVRFLARLPMGVT